MSADQVVSDLDAERDVDLRRWLDALLSRWWIAAVGLAIGAVIGAVYGLSGGSTYSATALIARGQAFAPNGGSVLTYITSPGAIEAFVTSEPAIRQAAAKVGLSPGELRGHVATSTVAPNSQSAAQATNSILVQITVSLPRPKKAEDAANALAEIVKRQTFSNYVRQSIQIYRTRLANYGTRLKTLQTRITALNATLARSSTLPPLDRLVIASQLDSAEAAYGQTLDSQTTNEQLLTLAQQVEQTQIVQMARAQKSVARSRRNSVVIGALIGLLIGTVVALIVGLRARRAPLAPA
jgi:capsular polysaccharide biosynthesis protein